jgi:hypothetical protein
LSNSHSFSHPRTSTDDASIAERHESANDRVAMMAGFVRECSGIVKQAKDESVRVSNELSMRQNNAMRFAVDLAGILVRVDLSVYLGQQARIARRRSRSRSSVAAEAGQSADNARVEDARSDANDEEEAEVCDVRLAANVVVTCIEHNLRRDCLEVVAKVLHFTEDEQRRVGLKRCVVVVFLVSFFLFVSVCLYVCLSVLFICLFVCLSTVCLSICQSISLFVCVCACVCVCVCVFVCLFGCLLD